MPKGIYIRTKKHGPNYKPELHITETRCCVCGCKITFICYTWSKQKFINGHQNKGKNAPMLGKFRSKKSRIKHSKTVTGKGNPMYGRIGEKAPAYKPECHEYETRYCKCTCEKPFICLKNSKQKYIRGHNRVGTHPSAETLELMSKTQLGDKGNMFGKRAHPKSGRGKIGKRKDLDNQNFRSRWEANHARVFNYEGIPFEYESKRFILNRKNGSKLTYCPDFHILGTNIWYEDKGYMNEKSKEKIQLFKEQYPEETLIVIGKEEYNRMKDTYEDLIPNWEKK